LERKTYRKERINQHFADAAPNQKRLVRCQTGDVLFFSQRPDRTSLAERMGFPVVVAFGTLRNDSTASPVVTNGVEPANKYRRFIAKQMSFVVLQIMTTMRIEELILMEQGAASGSARQ
jgi:hypothetical protein